MNAAAAGLELHPALGQAYLVPRAGQAQLQIGYKGLIALAQGHPSIAAIDAGIIRGGDEYELEEGTHPRLVIRRSLDSDGGEWVAAYCVTHYASGTAVPTVMTRKQVEAHRDKYSDAWKRGGKAAATWRESPEEMAKKTVLRRASKLWPISIPGGDDGGETVEGEAQPAQPADTGAGPAGGMRDVTPAEAPTPGSRLDAFAQLGDGGGEAPDPSA